MNHYNYNESRLSIAEPDESKRTARLVRYRSIASGKASNYHQLSKIQAYAFHQPLFKPNVGAEASKGLSINGLPVVKPGAIAIELLGVKLTIDPSLPNFAQDKFIVEKNRRAEVKLSAKD